MQILLEICSGTDVGAQLPLAPDRPVRFGRTEKADHVFPDDKQMSSLHFAVEYNERGCRLLDLNSSNGTFLNGARVKEATLANGDQIRAGSTVFVVRMLRDDSLFSSQPAAGSIPGPEMSAPHKPAAPASVAAPVAPSVPTPYKPTDLPASSQRPAPAALKPGELPSFPVSVPPVSFPVEPPAPKPVAKPPAPPRLQDLLAKEFQPLYALLDAAREPSVLKVIYESKEEFQSLYEGAQGQQLAHFAPYLIRIPQTSKLIDTLAQHAWSKSWGVFVTCDKPLKELRTHFRHFLNVKLPDGSTVYFRYYDPRVLRLFLPTCLPQETDQFFGPVKQFLMEAEDAATALHFLRGSQGTAQKELRLASA